MTRLRPTEMSALAQLAYSSDGLRPDLRERIVGSLDGDAKKIALAILGGHPDGLAQSHLDAANQLKDWAKQLDERAAQRTRRAALIARPR
ncbi:MAG: hypothetical protein SFX73_38045 [Kofleriaceae bacterium]|nr:hypothetical protein [Kofleriaceae bacterium]